MCSSGARSPRHTGSPACANNAGTVPPSWSSIGFTAGASAPSLRGFNDAYTLVLFDGMRSAVYPLADTRAGLAEVAAGAHERPA